MRIASFFIGIAILVVGAAATSAQTPKTTAVAGPLSSQNGWTTPTVVTNAGMPLFLHVVDDRDSHNLISTEFGPGGNSWCYRYPAGKCPRFASSVIRGSSISGDAIVGQVTPVLGVSSLEAGEYPFICQLHPITMTGTLVVV